MMDRLCLGCMRKYDGQFEICPYCGYAHNTPPEQAYHLTPGVILQGKYIVGRVLGFGGFGVTYIGWDFVMERKVAIKEYLPGDFATRAPKAEKVTVFSGESEEQFQAGMEKMMDEARRLAKFESVPGIVQIFDCFEANDTSYLIMEYLEGMTLKSYLKQNGPMSTEQALPIVLEIAAAMTKVHKTGILHRDIAPDNIQILNPEESEALRAKLFDFGASRYATTKHSKSLSVIIKPGYAPEEQYRSRGDQGSWTDVYALAATFYTMLTGAVPQDAMERGVRDELKRPSKMGVKLSKPVETALMNALNVKIQDRTQTMEEFSEELMAAEVKERAITKMKKDVGSIPKWVFAAGGVGVAAAALIIALMATGVIRTHLNSGKSQLERNMVRVPNVVNREADAAETLLQETGLGMSRDKMVYSEEIPLNMVSYQEIKENTPVERDTMVTVWISKGVEKGILPSVKGLSREEAQASLEEAGFHQLRFVESEEEGVYGSILKVSEEPGTNIELSKEIVLTVCVREQLTESEAILAEVPDLTGLYREAAEAALTDGGFPANWVEEFGDEPEGMVLGQDPAPGESLGQGSYITVRVSKGPEKIYMKNVELMTLAEAEAELSSLGLTIGTVREEYSSSIAKGKVISQSIPQDAEVQKGTAVDLVISRGPEPIKETKPAQTRPPETRPAQTRPPETRPPETRPPETQPPETRPPETRPPETKPPETQPPETRPPETKPPETEENPIWDFIDG